ncbi:MAG: hypothetical protein VX899_25340 [Myxococcota bacterium]|nr:hypothetical protein [Myxococcota bacterium]
MRTLKTAAILAAASALALSTGCTVMGGALMGSSMWGTGPMMGQGGISAVNGNSVVCLGTTADNVAANDAVYQVSGRVVETLYAWDGQLPAGFDNLVPCWTDVETATVIEDENGDRWTVGYAWLDGGGWDMTPGIYDQGAVELLVRHNPGTDSAGFVLSDTRGDMLYAMEAGRDLPALQQGDVPGIDVRTGNTVGRFNDACGGKEMVSVVFESEDDELELNPGDDQGMEADGNYYTVCSIESFERETQDDCSDDVQSEVSWVVFR